VWDWSACADGVDGVVGVAGARGAVFAAVLASDMFVKLSRTPFVCAVLMCSKVVMLEAVECEL
jgi:hypothetical protein